MTQTLSNKLHCSKYLKERLIFSIDNSATLAQFTGHLFSIGKDQEFPILLQHFERGL